MKNSKLIALILSSILLLTFTACSTSDKKETTSTTKKSTATTTAPTTTASSLSKITDTLPAFTITVGSKKITNAECSKLSVYSANSSETNSSGTVTKNVYKGYKLTDIFKTAGITSTENGFTVTKSDGSKITYDSNYALGTTLLAITKNDLATGGPFIVPVDSQLQSDFNGPVSSIAEVTTTTAATAQ